MNSTTAKAAKLGTTVLGVGLALGFLTAMTIPTAIRQHRDDTWRDRVEDTYGPRSEEAGDQGDYFTAQWQGAPTYIDPRWREATRAQTMNASLSSDASYDSADLLESASKDAGDYADVSTVVDDAAGASADAARAAAEDVRTVEQTAVQAPAPAEASADAASEPIPIT